MRNLGRLLAMSILTTVAAPSASADADVPDFVRDPIATFARVSGDGPRGYSLGVVVRFDGALPREGARVVIGPTLRAGDRTRGIYGGDTPRRIGRSSRHCYVIEVGRPAPLRTPRHGARWRLAVISGDNATVKHSAAVTLRRSTGALGEAEARRLGCYA